MDGRRMRVIFRVKKTSRDALCVCWLPRFNAIKGGIRNAWPDLYHDSRIISYANEHYQLIKLIMAPTTVTRRPHAEQNSRSQGLFLH